MRLMAAAMPPPPLAPAMPNAARRCRAHQRAANGSSSCGMLCRSPAVLRLLVDTSVRLDTAKDIHGERLIAAVRALPSPC